MVVPLLSSLYNTFSSYTPSGFLACFFPAFINGNACFPAWIQEFIGTMMMIGFTFSPGKWIGADSLPINWLAHAIGVVMADYIMGGPNVNPSVSVSMLALGKMSYTEALVRSFGAMAGSLVAFPFFLFLSETLKWTPLGGPEFNPPEGDDNDSDVTAAVVSAFYSEFFATMLLCVAIFVLNFELHFGKFNYWIKQSLTAVVVRYLIEVFPSTGPAMNPPLGTAWALFSKGEYPSDPSHYFVYWVASILGAIFASFAYAIFAAETFFGLKLPFGPVKKVETKAAEETTTASKKKKGTKKE